MIFIRTNKHTGRRFEWKELRAGARAVEYPYYAMHVREADAFSQMQRDKLSRMDFDGQNAVLSIEQTP